MGGRFKQIFLQRHTETDEKHMKKCSISLSRKMQIKTTVRYHLTPVRMFIIKKSTNKKFWRMWRKGNIPALLVGM